MSLNVLYHKFRRWQADPYPKRELTGEKHVCHNCETEFEGNFCPICGQDASLGNADWKAMEEEIKALMGAEAESPVSSVIQLLGRPGYVISDYCSGRRKVCDSPVMTLFMVATVVALVLKVTGVVVNLGVLETAGMVPVLTKALTWLMNNLGWASLLMTAYFILPTRLLFRFSPSHSRHTLPEGLFVQLFMSSLVLIFCALGAGVSHWLYLLIPVYYVIAYRQFFGYGWWGTLWRTVLVFVDSFLFSVLIIWVVQAIFGSAGTENYPVLMQVITVGTLFALIIGILVAGYYISRGKRKDA